MKIEIKKTLDLIDLANDSGIRQRDIQALDGAGLADVNFGLFCHFTDDAIDGHILVDHFDFKDRLNEISNALRFPFDLGGYKILTKAILDALEKYASSYEALVDASAVYTQTLEDMRDEALAR